MDKPYKTIGCRIGEAVLLLLLAVWLTGGMGWFPGGGLVRRSGQITDSENC